MPLYGTRERPAARGVVELVWGIALGFVMTNPAPIFSAVYRRVDLPLIPR